MLHDSISSGDRTGDRETYHKNDDWPIALAHTLNHRDLDFIWRSIDLSSIKPVGINLSEILTQVR